MTPASRSRVAAILPPAADPILRIQRVIIDGPDRKFL
jgi:hypothetical protein